MFYQQSAEVQQGFVWDNELIYRNREWTGGGVANFPYQWSTLRGGGDSATVPGDG